MPGAGGGVGPGGLAAGGGGGGGEKQGDAWFCEGALFHTDRQLCAIGSVVVELHRVGIQSRIAAILKNRESLPSIPIGRRETFIDSRLRFTLHPNLDFTFMAGRPKGLGRTPGSGRKAGTPNKRTLETARALVAAGEAEGLKLTPAVLARVDAIGVMEHVMKAALRAGQINLALDAARSVAPYLYPRLQAIAMSNLVKRTQADFTDEELLAISRGDTSGMTDAELDAINHDDTDTDQQRSALQRVLSTPRPVVVEDGEK